MFIVTALISLFAVSALALFDADFTASLSASRRKHLVGKEVQFTVHIENTGEEDILAFHISNTRGGVIETYGMMEVGESADIPVYKVFNAAGEFGVKFKVLGLSQDENIDVTTNTVIVTISAPQTPAPEPTPEPTQTPTPEPSQTQTPAATPEPTESAVLDEDIKGGQSETPKAQTGEQSTESEQGGKAI